MISEIIIFITFWAAIVAIPRGEIFGREKIVGGEPVLKNELPYQISLRYYTNHICGGAILNENYVVTAAHCVEGSLTQYLVAAGEHSLARDDGTEQIREISTITIHENYNSWTVTNDIALLKLKTPLILNEEVQTITLPNPGHTASGNGLVSGWGTLSDGGSEPDIPYKVTVPIMTDTRCRESYGDEEVADSIICAGYSQGGRDHCKGDGGGPLVCTDLGYPYLAGLVSWGKGCGVPNLPGAYTEVSYFTDWINETIALSP